ncbi:MAG TPA: zinc-binding alcohol dehydrogenase [Opitutaceae bacterium]|nr:zinc-binding alcohol dehydrogenase [Opitutaceae bacterium]
MKAHRLVFTGRQQVALEPFDPGEPGEDEVLVATRYSLMSTGTENIVFNRLFAPDTHWDRWVKYPFYPGYTAVGVVAQAGPKAGSLRRGDRVAFRVGHRSHDVVKASECYPIPDALPLPEAVWFSLAKITFHGALAARYALGDSVLVIGAGPIGQMSVRWARAAGLSSILVVDSVPDRMPLARAGGATETIVSPIGKARDAVLAAGRGRLPRVVSDATGNSEVLAAALGLAADRGTVVILGDTGNPTHQHLTGDVITRGLTIVGVHDLHNTPEWNNATITQLFFDLAAGGRFPLAGLNTHFFEPEQCQEAYATANRDRAKTMGIVFDWSGGKKGAA